MKLLFFQWNSFMNRGIENGFKELKIEFEVMKEHFLDWEKDEQLCSRLQQKIGSESFTHLFSVNYSPILSDVSEYLKLPYIAWVYDSPIHVKNIEGLNKEYTFVYSFDRGRVKELKGRGYQIEHMPLAADPRDFSAANQVPSNCFISEVSLVGKLYQTKYAYYSGFLSEYHRGYLRGMISAQMQVREGYFLEQLATQAFLEELNTYFGQITEGKFQLSKKELDILLASEVTSRERKMLLNLLGSRHEVDLYSSETDEMLNHVRLLGTVEYYDGMPQVFRGSKINLNITLRSILTGIPLRVLDVMACQGFLISNYQEEMLEYFRPDKDCVMYTEPIELVEKVKYYLTHEKERMDVIKNAYSIIGQSFQYKDRIKKMLRNSL